MAAIYFTQNAKKKNLLTQTGETRREESKTVSETSVSGRRLAPPISCTGGDKQALPRCFLFDATADSFTALVGLHQ